jgi:hypothetical protein
MPGGGGRLTGGAGEAVRERHQPGRGVHPVGGGGTGGERGQRVEDGRRGGRWPGGGRRGGGPRRKKAALGLLLVGRGAVPLWERMRIHHRSDG